ncbi:MAG: SRPBCC family protein [bacterium]|nr:SRPBCC family protein [bacterium]
MTSIRLQCQAVLPFTPEEIAAQILDMSRWPEFQGYGPLPGIRSAKFDVLTEEIVGTRIQVENTDGSTHVEEIEKWLPGDRLEMRMCEFSLPLSRLATSILEVWEFSRTDNGCTVVRSLEMFAVSPLTAPILWLLSFLLKKAIARHLKQMADGAENKS